MSSYDLVIIGSGPSGLTATIYATRAGFKTLVIAGSKWGGQLMLTTLVENFPGFENGIEGPSLIFAMRKQAEKFGAEILEIDFPETDFTKFEKGKPFKFTLENREIITKSILIATGADAKTLGVIGEKEFTGRGVSYCATCDGAFFKEKDILVVGGGDSAMEEANFLTHFARSVTIIHRRDAFKASEIMLERARKNSKISFLLNSEIIEILGKEKLEKVKIKNTQSQVVSELSIDGVFVTIGHSPNSRVFKGIETMGGGYIKNQSRSMTNVEGVFVSGDVEDNNYRQAITAAGFGAQAALDIQKWLENK